MKTVISSGVYTVEVTELEWHAATEPERDHILQKAMLGAEEANCLYVGVFVQPDDLFSDIGKKERVFQHTFPLPLAEELHRDLLAICDKYVKPGKLNITQVRAVVKRVFE